MSIAIALLTAVGLAACAGLRAFMPLFVAGAAARFFGFPLADSVAWLASTPALLASGAATVIELIADKVPVVDHALDAFQTVASPVAGTLVAFSVFGELPQGLALALAIMTGGTIAGGLHAATATARVKSTATTGGAANPILSVVEDILAVLSALAAILLPLAILLVLLIIGIWLVRQRKRRRAEARAA
jgi:hypothetical protein